MNPFRTRPLRLAAGFGLVAVIAAVALAEGKNTAPAVAANIAGAADTATPMRLIAADLVTVGEGSITGGVRLTGTLEPLRRASINARVAAVVDEVTVREGERVHKGQVLLRQVITDAEAQLRQAEAQLASAKVELDLTFGHEKRKKALFEKQYLSELDWAAAQGETEVKRGLVKIQEANVAIARRALKDTTLTAPISGIVAIRYVEPGSNVMPGQALLSIVDLSELELAADLPARDAARVSVGSEVSFTAEGIGERTFIGRIVRINPMAGSGRTLRVYALVDNRDGALRGGLFASGAVVPERVTAGRTDAAAPALRLPAAAVRQVEGKPRVWVIREAKLALQEVTLGVHDAASGQVEIRQGLRAGEQVILTDIGAAKAGTPVTVTETN